MKKIKNEFIKANKVSFNQKGQIVRLKQFISSKTVKFYDYLHIVKKA